MLALLRVAPLLPSSGRPNRTESNTALPQLLLPRGCEPRGRGIRSNPHGAGPTTNLTLNRSAIGDARSLSLRASRRSDQTHAQNRDQSGAERKVRIHFPPAVSQANSFV